MWRHSFIADLRPGQLSPSAPEIWPLGQIVPPWCGDGAGILVQRGSVPTASFQHDKILGATGAAAVSH